jgi:hypothetical protein
MERGYSMCAIAMPVILVPLVGAAAEAPAEAVKKDTALLEGEGQREMTE